MLLIYGRKLKPIITQAAQRNSYYLHTSTYIILTLQSYIVHGPCTRVHGTHCVASP